MPISQVLSSAFYSYSTSLFGYLRGNKKARALT
nr:MAG TPA: hypothetical protein [Caudoviricetes sp.]